MVDILHQQRVVERDGVIGHRLEVTRRDGVNRKQRHLPLERVELEGLVFSGTLVRGVAERPLLEEARGRRDRGIGTEAYSIPPFETNPGPPRPRPQDDVIFRNVPDSFLGLVPFQ